MSKLITLFGKRAYKAPSSDVCELLPDVLICESENLSIEDWGTDNNPINF